VPLLELPGDRPMGGCKGNAPHLPGRKHTPIGWASRANPGQNRVGPSQLVSSQQGMLGCCCCDWLSGGNVVPLTAVTRYWQGVRLLEFCPATKVLLPDSMPFARCMLSVGPAIRLPLGARGSLHVKVVACSRAGSAAVGGGLRPTYSRLAPSGSWG
jgi:hypothetical protein